MTRFENTSLTRRSMILSGAAMGAAAMLPAGRVFAQATAPAAAASTSQRMLGDVAVNPIGLGCQWSASGDDAVLNDQYGGSIPRETAIQMIREAVDQGVTLIDTAEAYGPFLSEEVVGEALQGIRDQVVLESKFGWDIDPVTGERTGGLNSKPEHVRTAIEGMLLRLRTDRLDIVYQHRVDPEVPIEDVAGVISDLMAEGKVLHWGLSEPGIDTIRRAHAAQPLAAIQNEYSMMWRGPEVDVLPLCEELGIGFVCWSPMAMGFLGGKMNAESRFEDGILAAIPRFAPDALPANMALFDVVAAWAQEKQVTPAQIALAWLSAQKPFVVPIPGTTKLEHMRENTASTNVTFTPEELAQLTAQVDAVQIQGARLPEGVLQLSGVDTPPKS
ncbi:aldo/keto reductase [Paracoccus aurantiacus]|uniref:Aldo/keto reductase n=1 Tax=Paracoccus aurantiacus TaxID=2599412 RepID=A0A5C6RTM8_9RHOB|nr:aldo/keto reductase [Paracoccus aurantiacus]TXB65658.1 aldo/keto reductase [Paracoccus aurantiacus]